jgi:soluble lytic murein transglycosylase-like protein
MITEAQIKAAIRAAAAGKPRVELRDDGPRGAGRLVLIARGSTAEWYACWHRDGKRAMSKLGTHPLLSLADARRRFREEFAPAISSGAEPTSVAARRRHSKEVGTIGDLFSAYVASLRAAGKRSAGNVEGMLSDAAAAIGSSRPAAEIEPGDVVAHLSAIHDRGEGVAKPLEFLAEAAGWDPQGKKAAEYADRVAAASSSTGEFDIGVRLPQNAKSTVSGWSKAFDKQFLGLGPDAALAKAIAGEESGFDPNAKNPGSTATGLFQFIKGTWAQFGGGGNPRNPDDATAAYAREIGRFRSRPPMSNSPWVITMAKAIYSIRRMRSRKRRRPRRPRYGPAATARSTSTSMSTASRRKPFARRSTQAPRRRPQAACRSRCRSNGVY